MKIGRRILERRRPHLGLTCGRQWNRVRGSGGMHKAPEPKLAWAVGGGLAEIRISGSESAKNKYFGPVIEKGFFSLRPTKPGEAGQSDTAS